MQAISPSCFVYLMSYSICLVMIYKFMNSLIIFLIIPLCDLWPDVHKNSAQK